MCIINSNKETGGTMNKDNSIIPPDVNQLIIDKLRSAYPADVAELAIKAVELSENLPEASVFETLQGLVREAARKCGGDS